MSLESHYPLCEQTGQMRPDVVWLGETPYRMEPIYAAPAACDPFISIGITGNVHPAAGFVRDARAAGARTIELNLEAE
ncbi:MAG TPA: NAD-dependent protein deacylase, partial [Rhizobiaceae bacterium]